MSKQASTLGRLRQPLKSSATYAAMAVASIVLAACGSGDGNSGGGTPANGTTLTTPVVVVDQAYTPLYGADTPVIERIQYSEADGTLVTLAGFRPTNRHARERGEPWMDAVDVGPGNFLTFPTFYFQNRTYGLVIRDEIPAGRQKITAYLKPNVGTFINDGFSAFRRVDADVIEYGWKDNVGFSNVQDGTTRCHASDNLAELCVAPSITDNWRSGDDGAASNVLKVGDKIEMSPAQFLDNTDGVHALIDGGGVRYYSLEQLYVVGKGMVPWYGIAPRLDSSPLPAEALLGGQASASYNYSEEPNRVFQQPVNNIGIADMQRFVEGRRLFHTSFVDGKHSESPDINPVFSAHINQLGARYNQTRCIECHTLNGRSVAAVIGTPLTSMSVLTAAADSTGAAPKPDATYGYNVQQRSSAGADYAVTVASYKTSVRTLAGGETVELQQPVYAFKGPVPAQFSVRQAPQIIGMGLLEAVDETTILALARNGDTDGVRGVPNWATDPETGKLHLGRFGWKAYKATLRQQAGDALIKDLGVTSPVFPSAACQKGVGDCRTVVGTTALSETEITRLANYLMLLAVPAQHSLRSGFPDGARVSPEHDVDPAQIVRGGALFTQARCVSCHTAEMKTSKNHPFAELRDQTIHPYTNMLLHDMGPEMADTLSEGSATPGLWRTAPLWGLGSLPYVQSSLPKGDATTVRYLHDGRARTLTEAIGWHGGEASAARANFEAMPKADRDAMLTFLRSL